NNSAPELKARAMNRNVSVAIVIFEASAGQEKKYDREQQENAARRGEFFKDRPGQGLQIFKNSVASPPVGRRAGVEISAIEAEAGLRILLELRHQLAQFEPVGHALPEAIELKEDSGATVGRPRRRRERPGWLAGPRRTGRTRRNTHSRTNYSRV